MGLVERPKTKPNPQAWACLFPSFLSASDAQLIRFHPSTPSSAPDKLTRIAPMALLAVHAMAASPAAFSSHHHAAVSSYCALPSAALSRSRSRVAAATALSAPLTPVLEVYCGRGDKKTKRGKRFNHSYGNARPRNKKKGTGPARLFAPPAPPRKDQFDDGEVTPIDIDEDILE
uniref:30S ribosomal protein S31, chloroplastic n=1 Tax=Oryza punctata TaxID=4537 RepID=A0A0E0KZB5_ORYPU